MRVRLLLAAVLLLGVACGPFGSGPSRATSRPPVPTTSPSPGVAPSPSPGGPAAVLLQLAATGDYTLSLLFANGAALGPVHARLRSVQPGAAVPGAPLPVFSTSTTRLYYLDGDTEVRYLAIDGTTGLASHVPGGPHTESGFAVSPDDSRIAIATVDVASGTPVTRLTVQDLDGGSVVTLPAPTAGGLWPVGWHGTGLIVAVGSAPTRNITGNPYGSFGGYQVLDPTTGARVGAIACDPAGALTPSGTACLNAGSAALAAQDFAGTVRPLATATQPVQSAAEAPDGARVAFCCDGTQLDVWDVGSGAVRAAGPTGLDASSGYGWVDATHLFVAGTGSGPATIVDVAAGTWITARAQGRVVARIPGGL